MAKPKKSQQHGQRQHKQEQRSQRPDAPRVPHDDPEATPAAPELDRQLTAVKREIEELTARLHTLEAGTRTRYEKSIEQLKGKAAELRAQLDESTQAGKGMMADVRDRVWLALKDLQGGVMAAARDLGLGGEGKRGQVP